MRVLATMLPARPSSLWMRYAATTAIVLVFCAFRAGVPLDDSRFIIFVPPVFIASLLFDRGCGYYATALSALAAETLFLPTLRFAPDPSHLPSLMVFILVCLGISIVNDGLRRALARVMETEAQARLLLEELGHRINNNLHMIISVLALQARRESDPRLKLALEAAVGRIRVIAEAHDRLRLGRRGERVEMRDYLQELCSSLAETVRDVRPIALRVDCEAFSLPSEEAVPVGLIINELVTNAFKHAFRGMEEGLVVVSVRRDGDVLNLAVSDNGVGCAKDTADGLGSRLVRMLVQQLNGTLDRSPATGAGCEVRVVVRPAGNAPGEQSTAKKRVRDRPQLVRAIV